MHFVVTVVSNIVVGEQTMLFRHSVVWYPAVTTPAAAAAVVVRTFVEQPAN